MTQSKEEVDFFQFLATNISSYIEIILEKKLISDKISLKKNALHESPYNIELKDDNSDFSSLAYDQYILNMIKF